jgi:hypothetical protein
MRRSTAQVLLLLALVAVLAGCGGGKTAAPPAPTTAPAKTTTAPPPFTSVLDLAACDELETKIGIVSQLVSSSVEVMTQSVHPKQLAKRAGATRDNILYAAHVLDQIVVPKSLVRSQHELTAGLRQFAADFGRAQTSVLHNNLPRASRQLVDRPALAKVTAATKAIDRACKPS